MGSPIHVHNLTHSLRNPPPPNALAHTKSRGRVTLIPFAIKSTSCMVCVCVCVCVLLNKEWESIIFNYCAYSVWYNMHVSGYYIHMHLHWLTKKLISVWGVFCVYFLCKIKNEGESEEKLGLHLLVY